MYYRADEVRNPERDSTDKQTKNCQAKSKWKRDSADEETE